jgi:hypothetical protein
MRDKDRKLIEPEVISDEEYQRKLPSRRDGDSNEKVHPQGPSSIPFGDTINRKRVQSFRKLVDANTELLGSIASYKKSEGRLLDIDIEIETDRLERRNRLRDVQRTTGLADRLDTLEGLKVDNQIAEEQAKLQQTRVPAKEKDPLELHAERLEIERSKKQIDERHEQEKQRSWIRATFEREQIIEEEFEREKRRRIAAIRKGRPFSELTAEELQALDLIEQDFADRKKDQFDRT